MEPVQVLLAGVLDVPEAPVEEADLVLVPEANDLVPGLGERPR